MEEEKTRQPSLGPNDYLITVGGERFRVSLHGAGQTVINGVRHSFNIEATSEGIMSLILDGTVYDVAILQSLTRPRGDTTVASGRSVMVSVNGTGFEATVDDRQTLMVQSLLKASRHAPQSMVVRAPMPGLIARLDVAVGQTVNSGQGMVVLEAMKMENEIRAIHGGNIDEIMVKTGQTVEKDEPLLRMTAL